jgi:hypothetical protein
MIRDGRDVATSLRTHPKYRWVNGSRVETGIFNPWGECVTRWVRDTTAGIRWRGHPRYIEVRYEELIDKPEQTIRRLLSFLGEEWDPAVLKYHESPREDRTSAVHPYVDLPLQSTSVRRWIYGLPMDARRCFVGEPAELLRHLEYAPEDGWIVDNSVDS